MRFGVAGLFYFAAARRSTMFFGGGVERGRRPWRAGVGGPQAREAGVSPLSEGWGPDFGSPVFGVYRLYKINMLTTFSRLWITTPTHCFLYSLFSEACVIPRTRCV